jgi:hypothetical protein
MIVVMPAWLVWVCMNFEQLVGLLLKTTQLEEIILLVSNAFFCFFLRQKLFFCLSNVFARLAVDSQLMTRFDNTRLE